MRPTNQHRGQQNHGKAFKGSEKGKEILLVMRSELIEFEPNGSDKRLEKESQKSDTNQITKIHLYDGDLLLHYVLGFWLR